MLLSVACGGSVNSWMRWWVVLLDLVIRWGRLPDIGLNFGAKYPTNCRGWVTATTEIQPDLKYSANDVNALLRTDWELRWMGQMQRLITPRTDGCGRMWGRLKECGWMWAANCWGGFGEIWNCGGDVGIVWRIHVTIAWNITEKRAISLI